MQLLKTSNRAINKAKAQEILLEIVNQEPIDFELHASALIHLCDLLYLELRQTGDPEVLDEMKHYIEVLSKYALQQQSYQFLAESYLIQSKIAQLELDMERAKELLEFAENSIYDKGLDKVAMKISSHYDELFDKMSTMSELIHKNATLRERLEEIELEETFNRILANSHEKLTLQEESPSMFLILKRASSSIYTINFGDDRVNEELIAGLLSALFTLSDEVFNTTASIQRIKHEAYTVIMKPVQDDLIFCYVFQGPSYRAVKKLEKLVNITLASQTIWDALTREISHLTQSEIQGMDLLVSSVLREI